MTKPDLTDMNDFVDSLIDEFDTLLGLYPEVSKWLKEDEENDISFEFKVGSTYVTVNGKSFDFPPERI